MIISPFTPLFFSPSTDKFGAKSKYVQLFARTDRIFVELILTPREQEPIVYINLKSATIIQYTIKGRFMSR